MAGARSVTGSQQRRRACVTSLGLLLPDSDWRAGHRTTVVTSTAVAMLPNVSVNRVAERRLTYGLHDPEALRSE